MPDQHRPTAARHAARIADELRDLGLYADSDTTTPDIASVYTEDVPGWSFHVNTTPIGEPGRQRRPGWFALRSSALFTARPVDSPLDGLPPDAPTSQVADAILLCLYAGSDVGDATQIRATRLGPDRATHLQRCTRRALAELDRGSVRGAFTSMVSDLSSHPGTAGHPALRLGMMLLINGDLDSPDAMRKFILDFQ